MKLTMRKPSKSTYLYDPMVHGVSQSMIDQWMECREKSRLNLLQGLTPKGCSKPLTYGSISHAAVEQYHLGLQDGSVKKLDDAYSRVAAWIQLGMDAWREENARANSDDEQIAEESCAILLEVLPRYFKHWWLKDTAVIWEKVEEQFCVKIGNGLPPIVGKYDGVFRRRGRLWLLETKNKGQFSERMMEFLPLDLQLGYYLTALAHSTQEDPSGVCYNLIRRPQERRKQTESLAQFAQRVAENIVKKPEHYFVRYEIELDRTEKEEHKRRARKLVYEFHRWVFTEDHTTRDLMWNSRSCEGKYGVCPNLSVCANGDKSYHYIRAWPSPELVINR